MVGGGSSVTEDNLTDALNEVLTRDKYSRSPAPLALGQRFHAHYLVDPGKKHAGLKVPDGSYHLHGHRKSGKELKSYTMAHMLKDLRTLPPGPMRIENSRLANKSGLTKEFIDAVVALGYGPLTTCNTRDADKMRVERCGNGHLSKPRDKPCDECTKRDLDAMATRPDNYFYPLKWDRPKTDKVASVDYKELLNKDRYEQPVPYATLQKQAPP